MIAQCNWRWIGADLPSKQRKCRVRVGNAACVRCTTTCTACYEGALHTSTMDCKRLVSQLPCKNHVLVPGMHPEGLFPVAQVHPRRGAFMDTQAGARQRAQQSASVVLEMVAHENVVFVVTGDQKCCVFVMQCRWGHVAAPAYRRVGEVVGENEQGIKSIFLNKLQGHVMCVCCEGGGQARRRTRRRQQGVPDDVVMQCRHVPVRDVHQALAQQRASGNTSGIQTHATLHGHREDRLQATGWMEFDENNHVMLTYSGAARRQETVSVWDLHDYSRLHTVNIRAALSRGRGLEDVKVAGGLLLLIEAVQEGATSLTTHIRDLRTGHALRVLSMPLAPIRALQTVEAAADHMLLKQSRLPLHAFNLHSGVLSSSSSLSSTNREGVSFVFLHRLGMFLTFSSSSSRVHTMSGRVVCDLRPVHCEHGRNCLTRNVFITEGQNLVLSYCFCRTHHVYALTMVDVVHGCTVREWHSEDGTLPAATRHALRDITAVYCHEFLGTMYTGHADGIVRVWGCHNLGRARR